jgi:hypothetical protein
MPMTDPEVKQTAVNVQGSLEHSINANQSMPQSMNQDKSQSNAPNSASGLNRTNVDPLAEQQ